MLHPTSTPAPHAREQVSPAPLAPAADTLWQRLADHRFDDARDARPFSTRLRQATGWSAEHVQRVLTEYRRFLYLAVRRQGRVCPSEAVDEAWHAHLLDSSRYFGDFCPRVLHTTLHHVPSRGGAGEGARQADHYRATLAAYEAAFGEPPPADIWPEPEQRFAERTRHLSSRTHWSIPKPAPWLRRHAGALRAWGLVLGLPAVLALGCAERRVTVQPGTTGPEFLGLFFVALVTLIGVGIWRSVRGTSASRPVRNTGLVPVEVGYLAGGALRAVQTALASLLQRGVISVNGQHGALSPGEQAAAPREGAGATRWRAEQPLPFDAHPFERAVHAQIQRGLNPEHALKELQPALDALHTQLHGRGLVSSPSRDARARTGADHAYTAAWALLLSWGALRAVHGWQRGLPVGFLIALLVASFIAFIVFQQRLPQRQTREGGALQRSATLALRRRRALGMADPLMPLALALVGTSALGPDLLAFSEAIAPMKRSDSGGSGCGGSGCSSGDGGDGGDGGGGGCGGCGGGD